jgi:hypothetical protein
MTTFQIVMVALGSLLGVSAFWDSIKPLLKSGVDKVKPKPKPVEPESPVHECDTCDIRLVDVVRCWEHLRCMCEEQNLDKAKAELDKIFPLLVVESEDKPNEA